MDGLNTLISDESLSKLFHETDEALEITAQVREEIEVRVLRHIFINPQNALYSQIAYVVLELLATPLFLLKKQLG